MYQIMMVDDDKQTLDGLRRSLRHCQDWQVDLFEDPYRALEQANTVSYDLVVSDYQMPSMDGVTFLMNVKELQPDSMRLILSGAADVEAIIKAVNDAGIYRFISKPVQRYDLILAIDQALQYYDTLRENKRLADLVRRQQDELKNREQVLTQFAKQHPLLVNVNWSDDGSIILEES